MVSHPYDLSDSSDEDARPIINRRNAKMAKLASKEHSSTELDQIPSDSSDEDARPIVNRRMTGMPKLAIAEDPSDEEQLDAEGSEKSEIQTASRARSPEVASTSTAVVDAFGNVNQASVLLYRPKLT